MHKVLYEMSGVDADAAPSLATAVANSATSGPLSKMQVTHGGVVADVAPPQIEVKEITSEEPENFTTAAPTEGPDQAPQPTPVCSN